MKKLLNLLVFLLLISITSFSQGGWIKPNNSYGTIMNRISTDSTFLFPTGCGTPTSLKAYDLKKSAIYFDSCNSKLWVYNPKVSAWVDNSSGSSDSIFVSSKIGGQVDSVGTRFSYSWATTPLSADWTDNTPSATITTGSSKTAFTGGAKNTSNHIDLSYYTGTENWTITFRGVIKSKSPTSFGLGISMKPVVLPDSYNQLVFYNLSDTAGYIEYISSNANLSSLRATNRGLQVFKWSILDTFQFSVARRQGLITAQMTNEQTGQNSVLEFNGDYQGAVSVGALATISLYTMGLDFDLIGSFKHVINEPKYPRFAIVGNSTSIGFGATAVPYRSANVAMRDVQGQFVVLSGNGEQTAQSLLRIPEIRTVFKPKYVIIEIGINDRLNSVSNATFGANVRTFVQAMLDSSITPIIASVIPLSLDPQAYNDTLQQICNDHGLLYLDINTPLRASSGTGMNTIYCLSDLIHPNNLGYSIIGNVFKQKLSPILMPKYSLSLTNQPLVTRPKYFLGLDDSNNVVSVYPNTSNDYIRNIPLYENDGTTVNDDVQNAELNITGRAKIGGSVYVIGTGSFSNPNFRVETLTGITQAGLFSSQNFSTQGGGQSQFNTGNVFFMNGARILAYQRELEIFRAFPNSGAPYSVAINNDQTGGAPPAGYKPLLIQENSIDKAWFTKTGGLHLKDTLTLEAISNKPLDSTTYKPTVVDASGNVYKTSWPTFGGGGGGGTNNTNAGAGYPLVNVVTQAIKSLTPGTGITFDSTTNSGEIIINSSPTGSSWDLLGNSGISASNWMGSSNNASVRFRTNNVQTFVLDSNRTFNFGLVSRITGGDGATESTIRVKQIGNNSFGTTYYAAANDGTGLSIGATGLFGDQDFGVVSLGGDVWYNVTRSNFGTNTNGHSTLQTVGSFATGYVAKTANYTLTATDHTVDATSNTFTLTLPTAASISGREYVLKNTGTGIVTISTTSSQTIDGVTTMTLSQNRAITVKSNGSNWIVTNSVEPEGTWTPTITNGANVASTANATGQYERNGNRVNFTVYVQVTPTASSAACIFDFSLPSGLTSNFTAQMDGICTGSCMFAGSNETAQGYANATDDRITVSTSTVGSTSARDVIITGHYTIK